MMRYLKPSVTWFVLLFVATVGLAAAEIDRVLEDLRHPNEIVRVKAASTIGDFGPGAEVIPALVRALGDESPRVRSASARALGRIGSDGAAAVEALTARLQDEDAAVRSDAATALGRIGRSAAPAVPKLIELLATDEDRVRTAVILAVSAIGPAARAALPALIELLEDPSPSLRASAARQIHHFGAEARSAVPRLAQALTDPDSYVREGAAWSLYEMGPLAKEAIPALIAALNDTDNPRGVRASSAWALGKMGPESRVAIPDLARALRAPHERIRDGALSALSTIDPQPDMTPEKANVLIDQFELEYQERLRTERLGAHVPDDVAQAIEDLDSGDTARRISGIEALAALGPRARHAVPALAAAIRDSNSRIWRAGVNALAAIGVAGIPTLTAALNDSREPVRRRVVGALGQLHERAHEAVPALVEIAERDTLELRKQSLRILSRMEADPSITVPAARRALRESELRLAAIRLLESSGNKRSPFAAARASTVAEAVPDLAALLNTSDPDVQKAVVRALGELGGLAREAAPALARLFRNADSGVRSTVLRQLPKLGPLDDETKSLILSALDDPDDDVRADGVSALAKIDVDAERAVPVLTRLLTDPNLRIRTSAAHALGSIGPDAAVAAGAPLVNILESDHQRARQSAVQALGKLGQDAAFAVPALMGALGDPYAGVRSAACRALAALMAESALPELRRVADSDYSFRVRDSAARAIYRIEEGEA
jgi:HEAT repeat protein